MGYDFFKAASGWANGTTDALGNPIQKTDAQGNISAPTTPGTTVGQTSTENNSDTTGKKNGHYTWDGTKWVWTSTAPKINSVGSLASPDVLPKAQLEGKNPFGDQYSSNLQYTPFGLTPYQQQPGQYGLPSAFGGLSYNSDLLVPQLENIRMQRIMQTYSPQGGGNNGGK